MSLNDSRTDIFLSSCLLEDHVQLLVEVDSAVFGDELSVALGGAASF